MGARDVCAGQCRADQERDLDLNTGLEQFAGVQPCAGGDRSAGQQMTGCRLVGAEHSTRRPRRETDLVADHEISCRDGKFAAVLGNRICEVEIKALGASRVSRNPVLGCASQSMREFGRTACCSSPRPSTF